MENMRILRSRWASGTYLRRLFQQPPLPTAATVALEAITCDLGIVASVPLGRTVLDFVSGLQNPTFRIAKFGEPTLWRPALLRAIDSFGQSGVHNR